MSFSERVIHFVRQIPKGKVASYGQIAALAGSPRSAITVGQILHNQSEKYHLPWQRVINSRGYISTTCLEHPAEMQASLLEAEGVKVKKHDGLYWIDLKNCQWQKEE